MNESYRTSLIITGLVLCLSVISWRLVQLEAQAYSPPAPIVQRQPETHIDSPPAQPSTRPQPSEADRARALFEAARKGDFGGILSALSKGANVNTTNEEGLTLLLSLAKEGNHSDLIQKLLEHGANAAAKDTRGWNALTWAADRDDVDTISVLLKHSPGLARDAAGALFRAAVKNHVEALKTLLDNGVDVNRTDKEGKTAVHYAAAEGDSDTLKFLADHSADLNRKTHEGLTPLMLAVKRGDKDVVQALLEKSASVSERNSRGETALVEAVRAGNTDISQALLAAGTDINAPDFEGNTPLMTAAGAGKNEIVQFLLDKNADVNVKNSQSETALSIARRKEHADTADLLTKAGASDE